MTTHDPVTADSALGQLTQQLQDEHGIDLRGQVPEPGESVPEMIERLQYAQDAADTAPAADTAAPSPTHANSPPTGPNTELSTGQTIHDAAHWLGRPAEEAGALVGGEFVATGAWGGGILEDDVVPLEHRVYTEGEQPEGEFAASWVLVDGAQIEDTQFQHADGADGSYFYYDDSAADDAYESGYADGFTDASDDAGEE